MIVERYMDRQKTHCPITILDYGVGNVGSVVNMFDYLGIDAITSDNPALVRSACKLVLPGVGAFDRAMSKLSQKGLIEPLNFAVRDRKIPVLGVCLGMQLLMNSSEEGSLSGLGFISGDVVRISSCGGVLKVPHMGWQEVQFTKDSPLIEKEISTSRFYFDHSYHVRCQNTEDILATFVYGEKMICAVQRDNIVGVQFHPEKSHKFGLRLLNRFASIPGECCS